MRWQNKSVSGTARSLTFSAVWKYISRRTREIGREGEREFFRSDEDERGLGFSFREFLEDVTDETSI